MNSERIDTELSLLEELTSLNREQQDFISELFLELTEENPQTSPLLNQEQKIHDLEAEIRSWKESTEILNRENQQLTESIEKLNRENQIMLESLQDLSDENQRLTALGMQLNKELLKN